MAETATQGIISPVLSDTLTFLNIALSIILMFVVAYLWTTRHQTGEIGKLNDKVKRLANDLKALEEKVDSIKVQKVVEKVPEPEPFGIDIKERKAPPPPPPPKQTAVANQVWSKFVDDYNHIAASMLVPGELQACQKFVDENELRIVKYGMTGNLLPAFNIEESNFWAWKIPGSQTFAIVPNPLKPCTAELYENGGMKNLFAMNFTDGVYRKYTVKVPAIFVLEGKHWDLKDPGVVDLARQ